LAKDESAKSRNEKLKNQDQWLTNGRTLSHNWNAKHWLRITKRPLKAPHKTPNTDINPRLSRWYLSNYGREKENKSNRAYADYKNNASCAEYKNPICAKHGTGRITHAYAPGEAPTSD